MIEDTGASGFDSYKHLILQALKRHDEKLDAIQVSVSKLQVEVATVKVKAGFAGLFAGGLASVLAALGYLLVRAAQ